MARREGEAFIEVHADTDPFAREAERGVKRGAEAAEDELTETGDKWGETLADAMADRLEKEGPNLAKGVQKGLGKQKVKVPVQIEYDRDRAGARRVVSRVVEEIEEAVQEAATGGGASGGVFGKLGAAFSDAIGAGFNVSGRSPLIMFLVPVLGAIIGLVAAAIQALSALAAVAITLPGILASVGIQIGVLMVAFEGIGTAIQGAFAATNARELREALKDLTPAARDFVKSLLPLEGFFKRLKTLTQETFFRAFGDDLFPELLKFQGGRVMAGFQAVAKALGTFLHDLGFFFNSDAFANFLDNVFPRTVTFLEQFGPSFITFLEGLLVMVNAAMPFLTKVGDIVAMVFKQVGDAFAGVADDPAFLEWLGRMEETLMSIVNLFRAAGIFIGALFDAVDKAGGQAVIDQFAESLIMLAVFLQSEFGIKGMTALIEIAIFSIKVVTGLIIVFMFALAAVREFFIFLGTVVGPAVLEFFGAAANAVAWFFSAAVDRIVEFWNWLWWIFVGGGINQAVDAGVAKFAAFLGYLASWVSATKNWFAQIPAQVQSLFSNTINWLYNAGRNVIQGLINGVRSMFNPLRNAMANVGGLIRDYLPFSPAKEGPLSGRGDPQRSGQTIVQRLATGMEMEAPALRSASSDVTQNIVFGANSIQMRINGPMDRDQARAAGTGVAEGIWSNLNRDTRLAIRMM